MSDFLKAHNLLETGYYCIFWLIFVHRLLPQSLQPFRAVQACVMQELPKAAPTLLPKGRGRVYG
jgi:hypothetical protein